LASAQSSMKLGPLHHFVSTIEFLRTDGPGDKHCGGRSSRAPRENHPYLHLVGEERWIPSRQFLRSEQCDAQPRKEEARETRPARSWARSRTSARPASTDELYRHLNQEVDFEKTSTTHRLAEVRYAVL